MEQLTTYNEALSWLHELKKKTGDTLKPHLLLGNGFSIAFDYNRFSYSALRFQAEERGLIGELATHIFTRLETQDFELVIKTLQDAALALDILDNEAYHMEIETIRSEVAQLKEALAQVLAGLHPERPYDISDDAYLRVRRFIDSFNYVYTANYDLLLYWSLMKDFDTSDVSPRVTDDGFRSGEEYAQYVLWDHLKPHQQCIYYLHGALHLFQGDDGLRKLTWVRTNEPLIDQIRRQLSDDFFPLYVSEGSSKDKMQRIHSSDYLSKALRSLAAVGGSILTYGLSFSANDEHILTAIARSKVERIAVSIYGDPKSVDNRKVFAAVEALQRQRNGHNNTPLSITYFDAESIRLWK